MFYIKDKSAHGSASQALSVDGVLRLPEVRRQLSAQGWRGLGTCRAQHRYWIKSNFVANTIRPMDPRAGMTPRWNSVWSRDRVSQCSLTKEVQEVDSLCCFHLSTPGTLPNSHQVDPTQREPRLGQQSGFTKF